MANAGGYAWNPGSYDESGWPGTPDERKAVAVLGSRSFSWGIVSVVVGALVLAALVDTSESASTPLVFTAWVVSLQLALTGPLYVIAGWSLRRAAAAPREAGAKTTSAVRWLCFALCAEALTAALALAGSIIVDTLGALPL